MERIFIVGAKRTPIGKFGGALASLQASDLGALAIEAAYKQAGVEPAEIDQVIMGNVIQAGQGQNPARQATLKSGLPVKVPAITINDVCGSGLTSINIAASLIQSGQADVIIAGGMESMSNAPYVLKRDYAEQTKQAENLIDTLQTDALIDAEGQFSMGITAENIAEKYAVSRDDMDYFAEQSHAKAVLAQQNDKFASELVPVTLFDEKGETKQISLDEGPRPNSTFAKLSTLKPVFKENGTVTAGNASGINDGAAALVLISESRMHALNLSPLAEWKNAATVGLEPAYMGLGPYYAIKEILAKANLSLSAIDMFELNEAFAAQAIASNRLLNLDTKKINPKGGALALGHPVGASGSRILVTLIYNLIENKAKTGLAALCVGGGMGVATLIENAEL
ncbi:acetyl-CoA acetyltransferase [Weissella oryzae SG25]|uniref:acetyl-CoA C-acetyltransferase n=1 Tax=Weissella oryzae (strain DSM 25784 / JCM 18191 / LMG 30913 / SG25) TaxID=1329250 RepID=A0A069CT12_WEIOS|nr:thiolase family protein [Weissella oryzae]GAK30363.1 acetyl-CoA acetyltransferase [Weissella oryzae SG25]